MSSFTFPIKQSFTFDVFLDFLAKFTIDRVKVRSSSSPLYIKEMCCLHLDSRHKISCLDLRILTLLATFHENLTLSGGCDSTLGVGSQHNQNLNQPPGNVRFSENSARKMCQ